MQAHVAINTHAHTHTNKCHTNTHITLWGTHTHAFYGSTLIARELPAVGDLWENRTPPVPLSSPHEPRETLRPTGATSIYSLIPSLIAACPLFSIGQFIPVFVVPSQIAPSVRLISKAPDSAQLFWITSRLFFFLTSVIGMLYLESLWWWDLMRFRSKLKWTVFPDVAPVVAR